MMFATSCSLASPPPTTEQLQELHQELMGKFVPVDQSSGDRFVHWTGYEDKIIGDCDDFATAAYMRMAVRGWKVRVVTATSRHNGNKHIMACTQIDSGSTACLDNVHGVLVGRHRVAREYTEINYKGWKRYGRN